jgi:pyruvate dehydrogenase E2 component (dihydrolipoamide acetyltransferase)
MHDAELQLGELRVARIDVIMPQMGESIAEGTVSRWLKKVGDEVKRDEPIFEISTDKVDAEIPSPSAGVLAEIIIGEGKTVAVQTVVARIETEKGAALTPAPVAAPAAPAPAPVAAPSAPVRAPVPVMVAQPTVAAPRGAGGSFEERIRTKSSPLVRRIAAEHGVEISQLTGSGIAGRVTKRDLVGFLESGAAVPAAAPSNGGNGAVTAPAHESHAGSTAVAWPGDLVEPMSKLRRLTSDHMGMAIRVATHVTTFFEIDLTRVARVRAAMRTEFESQTGQKLTYLPFIIQAVVATLKRHPIVNAAVNGNEIIFRRRYNIGLAVALEPTGLIVPVIKHAEDLSLSGIAKAANDLASRARSKKLGPADAQDATFTITNPGVFGSLMGTPIIPVGTTSILGLGTIEKRPKVITGADGEDTIAIRTCAYFFLSFDHKVVDGADADRFMGDLKRTLESIPEKGF